MKKFKVSDLKKILDEKNISPEDLSKELPISNMTIRRWLEKKDSFALPEKYQVHFEQLSSKSSAKSDHQNLHFSDMETDLLSAGQKEINNKNFLKSIKSKLTGLKTIKDHLSQVQELIHYVSESNDTKIKFIALGALAYFLNPFDLVPDALGLPGYLDDIGVMTYAISKIKEFSNN